MTVNEMIYKTLNTKITKEPKYKNVLEKLGYELVKDHDWSFYDYWAIKLKEDGRLLVISKGRDKERHLYKTANFVNTKNIEKVDFERLININRKETRAWNIREPESNIHKYKRLKWDYEYDVKKYNESKFAYESAKKNLERAEQRVVKSKEELCEIIAELKK